MTPKQRMKALIRNYERHLEDSGKPPTAPNAFLYMDMCELIIRHEKGLTDDASLERLLEKIEGQST